VAEPSSIHQELLIMLPLFTSFKLKGILVKNRVIMPQMICFDYPDEKRIITKRNYFIESRLAFNFSANLLYSIRFAVSTGLAGGDSIFSGSMGVLLL